MKRLLFGFLALATALAIAPAASATTIAGTLGITGGDDMWTASGITFNNPAALAVDATGDFGTILGVSPATAPATINDTNFSFISPDTLIFTVGATTGTFSIIGPIDVFVDNGEFLDISGSGLVTLSGYSSTAGSFSFDSTDSSENSGATGSSTFGFDIIASGVATVITPEPAGLILLGTGLLSFAGLIGRKLVK